MSKASALSKKLIKISTALQKRYGDYAHEEFDDFIEAMMHQILALGASNDLAKQALQSIREEFVDWNDMRMANVREVQDILGDDYPRCREKSEDVINLLADLYTAFRKMKVTEIAPTEEGMQTLRALDQTTLVRRDMVEHALNVVYSIPTFACDEGQYILLQFLGGMPADTDFEDGMFEISQALVDDQISADELHQLSHGLRCHADYLAQYEIFDPKPIGYGWDKPDPLNMKVPAFKSEIKEIEKIDPIKPAPKPKIFTEDGEEVEETLELDDLAEAVTPVVKVVGIDEEGNEVSLPGDTITPLNDPEEDETSDDDATTVVTNLPIFTSIADAAKGSAEEESAPAEEAKPKKAPAKKAAAKKDSKTEVKTEAKKDTKKTAVKKETKKETKKAAKKETKKAAAKKTVPKKDTKKAVKKAAPKKDAKKAAKKAVPKKDAKKAAGKKSAAKKAPAKKAAAKKTAKKAASKKSSKKSAGKKK